MKIFLAFSRSPTSTMMGQKFGLSLRNLYDVKSFGLRLLFFKTGGDWNCFNTWTTAGRPNDEFLIRSRM